MDNTEKETIVNDNDSKTLRRQEPVDQNYTPITNCDSLSSLNFFDEQQMVAFKNFAIELMRSDKGGIKSVNDALAIAMRAQALNLPFGTALDHIHVINGKTGVDIHIIKALLIRGKCTWNCTKNYHPVYEFTDGFNIFTDDLFPDYVKRCNTKKDAEKLTSEDKDHDYCYVYPVKWYQDFNGNLYKDYQLNSNTHEIVVNRQQAAEVVKNKKIPIYRIPTKPVDYITEFVFTRKIDDQKLTAISSFSYKEAVSAGLFEKDNWKKYPKVMLAHRAFSYGARDIASDLIMGCLETTEVKIIAGQDLDSNDFDEVEVLN